jgi:uncharacterized protein
MTLQRCTACAHFRYPPRPRCPYCAQEGGRWDNVSGNGVVYSFTRVVRGAPGYELDAPYVFALVELAEGPIIATRLVGANEEDLAVGMPVDVSYLDVRPDLTLPYFTPQG